MKDNSLDIFQTQDNRDKEQSFARTFAENEKLRVFFVNENEAYTDGKNIVLDPGFLNIYNNKKVLQKSEAFLNIKNHFSSNPYVTLKMVTRALNIHESLHILYSKFPRMILNDKERTNTNNRKHVLATIDNIIEDAFIENVGVNVYDNLDYYLICLRTFLAFTQQDKASKIKNDLSKDKEQPLTKNIIDYMNYMLDDLLNPVSKINDNPDIQDYIDKTKDLYKQASLTSDVYQRYELVTQVFDIIQDLIPKDIDITNELKESTITVISGDASKNSTSDYESDGRLVDLDKSLFDGINEDFDSNLEDIVLILDIEASKDLQKFNDNIKQTKELSGNDYDASSAHKDIKIREIKPKVDTNLSTAYQNLLKLNRLKISTYANRFDQLLKSEVLEKEERKLFGSSINSKKLYDSKKRYWSQTNIVQDKPDLSILIMIDGSGSMQGARRKAAIKASVILYEVLKKQDIEFAIVEHMALSLKNEVEHTILLDFNDKSNAKYNIMSLRAKENTREGLSLYWAEKYLNTHATHDHKIIFMISDGQPIHYAYRNRYEPPFSQQDTKNAASKIIKRGTDIIAIALNDEQGSCYKDLKEIYPNVIECSDLDQLTNQLLNVILSILKKKAF